MAGIAIVGFFSLLNHVSSTGGGPGANVSAPADAVRAQQAIGTAVAARTSPPVEPLSGAGVRKGFAHVRLASVEGLAGEMVYSQNCYDELARRFAWARLDVCGAFDAEAATALGDEEPAGAEKEVAWFQSETTAGRYLKAAVAAGEDADEADRRLADLQARASRGAHVNTGPPAALDGADAPEDAESENAV